MKRLRYEIIDKLEKVDEITSEIYENLILLYDKKLVDSVIDGMIDEENILKYDFYISMKLNEFDTQCIDTFKLYMKDIKSQKKFNYLDNKKYTTMVYDVINELEMLFYSLGYTKEIVKKSIDNKVKYCFEYCKDIDKLREIRKLYNKYIDLRNQLVIGNLSLVISMAKPYFRNNDDDLEIIQNGNEGLISAIEKYNPRKNAGFSTCAYFWIRNNIIKGLRYSATSVTVPYYIMDLNSKRLKAIKTLTVQLGREPNDEELSKFMNISVDKIQKVRCAYDEVLSLSLMEEEELLDESGDKEIFVDKNTDVFKLMMDSQENCSFINKIKKYLTAEEFFVLSKRYGLDDDIERTYQDIGTLLGMTGANVRVIHKRALQKVRKKFSV